MIWSLREVVVRGSTTLFLAIVGLAPNQTRAATLTSLVEFNFGNGAAPSGDLIADIDGNLFGTTSGGGAHGKGTVFEIAKTTRGYASSPTVLVSFKGSDGASPKAGVIADAAGNLFGTTSAGGTNQQGTVFEIAKTRGGYSSTPTTLINFSVSNGAAPSGGVIVDAHGNLFGTTSAGGAHADGTVFELVKTPGGYNNSLITLFSFDFTNGATPLAGLIADAGGNLIGTTSRGGAYGQGTIFEIIKNPHGYARSPINLVSFDSTHGAAPAAGVLADTSGNLFGTTSEGGAYGKGTVFEIAKTPDGYADSSTTLASFNGDGRVDPKAGVIVDGAGNLFGTTSAGGAQGYGTVFVIAKTPSGYASEPTTLVSFDVANGAAPSSSLISDSDGNLIGTTSEGGRYRFYGTIFEITGSGFVPGIVPRAGNKVTSTPSKPRR